MILKLALRNLAAHKVRLLLTTAAVTLGVAFVAGSLIVRDTAASSFDRAFGQAAESSDVAVQATQPDAIGDGAPRQVPDSLLVTLRARVAGAGEFRQSYEGYAAVIGRDGEVIGSADASHIGRDFVATSSSSIRIETGRAPTGADEIVVDTRTATQGGLAVGDRVQVLTQGPTRTMTVSGVFGFTDDSLGDIVTYVGFAPEVARQVLVEKGYSSAIWARPRAGVTQQQLQDQISAVLPAGFQASTGQQQADQAKASIGRILDLLSVFLLAFAVVSVFIGSFIIFNTFSMLVAQRTRELALLRAIGASRRQVNRLVLGEALGVGLLGSTVGLLAGVGVSVALRALFGLFGAKLPAGAPVIHAPTVVWSYVVGVLVTMAAAYAPARRAGKVAPVAAMRDDPAAHAGSPRLRLAGGVVLILLGGAGVAAGLGDPGQDGAFLVGLSAIVVFLALAMLGPALSRPAAWLLGAPFVWLGGTVGRLSRENARRDPRRTAATAAALMIGLGLVSMAAVLASSMNASVDKAYDDQFGADFALTPRGLEGFSPDAVKAVSAVPGVRAVAEVQNGTLVIGGAAVPIVVSDPATLTGPVKLAVADGTATLGTGDVLVQQRTADAEGLRPGSTVTATFPDEQEVRLRVAGVFADNRVVDRAYIMTPAAYHLHAPGSLIATAYVDLDDGRPDARKDLRQALAAYPNVQLTDRQQAKDKAHGETDQILSIIMGLLVLSIVIAALGIANTLALSMIERTRELGLLRAIGMSGRQVRRMVRFESVIIATYGAVLGLLAGTAAGWALQRSLATEGVGVFRLPAGQLGLYLLGAVVIGIVAALWPAWRSSRMNILNAIAS